MPSPEIKKLSQAVQPDGSVIFTFHGFDPEPPIRPEDFPENVLRQFTLFGMRTMARNATIGSESKDSIGSPAEMRARMIAKLDAWKKGEMRVAVETGERLVPLEVLEAASIYKAMKAAAAAKELAAWAKYERPAPESLRAEVEALAEACINEAEVAKIRAEKGDEAAEKATVTKLDQLKATDLFKLALVQAKKARSEAREAQLLAKLAAAAE